SVSDLEPRLEKWIYRQDEAASSADANSTPEAGKDRVVMSGTVEEQLTVLWRNFFGNQEINVDDDFFEIGGDSLKALTMIGRIHKALDLEISMQDFFQNTSIRKLHEHLQRVTRTPHARSENHGQYHDNSTNYEPIVSVTSREVYPLSHQQKRLYIQASQSESVAFNVFLQYRMNGNISMEALASAFNALLQRHESLRTIFLMHKGAPHQKILSVEDCGFTLEFEDVSQSYTKEFISSVTDEMAFHVFSLHHPPLLRVKVLKLSDEQYLGLLSIHHIVTDGWSQQVLFHDLLT